ncbi:UDP-N-acetylmuramate dehydrogenase [Brevibacterium litoralis]|uniref:UDP-N-acetylmuramate dehydrogenase n=1 Tax=Brevibacterium litoralis TaxID=3138935 RepID=UPI0032EB36C5
MTDLRPDTVRLADLTTMRVGGPAATHVRVATRQELVDFCRSHPLAGPAEASPAASSPASLPDTASSPASLPDAEAPRTLHAPTDRVLFVAGGSNLLVSDAGYPGTVCEVATRGIEVEHLSGGRLRITAEAGENWDDFVAHCAELGARGLEPLSGIPGCVGSTPVQNVGAYGAEVSRTIESVLVHDRTSGDEHWKPAEDLGFGYRTSLLKRSAREYGTPRFVVLAVRFVLDRGEESAPIAYPQLARALDVDLGDTVPAADVRRAVLALRASKGMVLDEADHDTWSCGSFFTNPVLDSDHPLPDEAPYYPVVDALTGEPVPGRKKTSAAWLIDTAGFGKGFHVGAGRASLSTKHTLALTNRGEATCEDVLELARHVVAGVQETYGITLVPEPELVGVHL